MADDIVTRLQCAYRCDLEWPCEECTFCAARAEIERLRAAIDGLLAEIDTDHQPEWASTEAKAAGKQPWCCRLCGPADGGWPCSHRMALDDLKEAHHD